MDEEEGAPVRCPHCDGKRLRAWAPGVIACEACQGWYTLFDSPVEKSTRIRCARRCRRALVYLTAATAARAGYFQCVECGQGAPLPFDIRAWRELLAPRVLWRDGNRFLKRRRTGKPFNRYPAR